MCGGEHSCVPCVFFHVLVRLFWHMRRAIASQICAGVGIGLFDTLLSCIHTSLSAYDSCRRYTRRTNWRGWEYRRVSLSCLAASSWPQWHGFVGTWFAIRCHPLQLTATHCNAPHCNILVRGHMGCHQVPHTATHCSFLSLSLRHIHIPCLF